MTKAAKFAFPVGSVCSVCGKVVTLTGSPATRAEHWKAMQESFEMHVKEKHSREDVNQLAARIVDEATKD